MTYKIISLCFPAFFICVNVKHHSKTRMLVRSKTAVALGLLSYFFSTSALI